MNALKDIELHQFVLPLNLFFQLYQIKMQYDMDYNVFLPLVLILFQRILRIIDIITKYSNQLNQNNNQNDMDFFKTLKRQQIFNQNVFKVFIQKNQSIVSILFYYDKIYYDYIYDNLTSRNYFLGMVYYQTFYNFLFSLKMLQGHIPSDINLRDPPQCYNMWIFHESFMNIQTEQCPLSNQNNNNNTSNQVYLIFALVNGLVINAAMHLAAKIGFNMKSEIMYFLKVRILEIVKYFTILFFKVFLVCNYAQQYIITQVIKIISIQLLPLTYNPIQKSDFFMSSIFQVNLYPAALSYTGQGLRVIEEQNMRDTQYFLIIEQIDSICSILFYLAVLFQFRNQPLFNTELIFIYVSVIAQIINLFTMIHVRYLLRTVGPFLKLNLSAANFSQKEFEKLIQEKLSVITQQISVIITEEADIQNNNVRINSDMVKTMLNFSKNYGFQIFYRQLKEDLAIIFELQARIKGFLIKMSDYQLLQYNYQIFEKICQIANDEGHKIEFDVFNFHPKMVIDAFSIYKFKLNFIKMAIPKHDISQNINKIPYKQSIKYEYESNQILKQYVADCNQVLAYLKKIQPDMLFNPQQILYDLYDSFD